MSEARKIAGPTMSSGLPSPRMIERQKVLAAAWKEAKAAGGEGAAFQKKWMEIRNAALAKAGFDPIFK